MLGRLERRLSRLQGLAHQGAEMSRQRGSSCQRPSAVGWRAGPPRGARARPRKETEHAALLPGPGADGEGHLRCVRCLDDEAVDVRLYFDSGGKVSARSQTSPTAIGMMRQSLERLFKRSSASRCLVVNGANTPGRNRPTILNFSRSGSTERAPRRRPVSEEQAEAETAIHRPQR